MPERLEQLLARLEQERVEADGAYHAALTALDRALQRIPEIPHPPPAYDEQQITPINQAWKILPNGPPPSERSLKGRLRAFIWRSVGPPLEQQQHFNAAVVDHLNRNVAAHREAERAIASLIALTHDHIAGAVRMQQYLIQYLQTMTLYIDTKDRVAGGQAQVLNAALSALADDWLKRWESLTVREQRFNARVSALDELQSAVGLAQQTSLSLKRTVERLLEQGVPAGAGAATAAQASSASAAPEVDLDSFKYVGFEDAFRGSQTEIRRRLEEYVPRFQGQAEVLDIGCGRGEFLDLLRDHGVQARGVDLNREMVEVSKERGLDVVESDALGYLRGLPDGSLGGIFGAQVIEHLEPAYLTRLIEAAFHALRPGGILVLETINASCWLAFFESYIRDLTHVRPIHPETLQYLLRASGFQHVEIEYKAPVPESARLAPVPVPTTSSDAASYRELVETVNENVTKLNALMFTYQDYAVIGKK